MTDLNGKSFVAKVRLSDRQDQTLADVGQTCERVPAASLGWLLADGLIEAGVVVAAKVAAVAPSADDAPAAHEE